MSQVIARYPVLGNGRLLAFVAAAALAVVCLVAGGDPPQQRAPSAAAPRPARPVQSVQLRYLAAQKGSSDVRLSSSPSMPLNCASATCWSPPIVPPQQASVPDHRGRHQLSLRKDRAHADTEDLTLSFLLNPRAAAAVATAVAIVASAVLGSDGVSAAGVIHGGR